MAAAPTATNEQLTSTMHDLIAAVNGHKARIELLEQRMAADRGGGGRHDDAGVGLVDELLPA